MIADNIRKDSIFRDTAKCDKIVIDYLGLSVSKIVQISCEHFDAGFYGEKKEIVIEKGSKLFANYDSLFALFTINKDQMPNGIDVRMEIKTFCQERKLKTICTDYFGRFYFSKNGKYYTNAPLAKYLLENIWNQS